MRKQDRFGHVVGRCLFAVFTALSLSYSLTLSVHAASSAADKRVTGDATQGGGTSFGSSFRQQVTVGGGVAANRVSSSSFRVAPPIDAVASTLPAAPSNLVLKALYARTDVMGSTITPAAWQTDRDPIFIWEVLANGVDAAGYSIAVDAAADGTIDTTGTSFNVATDPLGAFSDGKHTFAVRAVDSAGHAGDPLSMELWVDATPPQVTTYTPAAGALLNTAAPDVTVTVTDASSGVRNTSAMLLVNGQAVALTLDAAAGRFTSTGGGWKDGNNSLEWRLADAVGNAIVPLIWSVVLDTVPPTGAVTINGNALTTKSIYVTLNLTASDATSGVARMLLSNEASSGYVEKPFSAVRELWLLNAIRGPQTVYVKFVDRAGNMSGPISDLIDLTLLSPETVITSGPSGVTQDRTASFAFMCPEGDCEFSYAFDGENWSAWSTESVAVTGDLAFGNHYFRVKAARDVNGAPGIHPDEEDPSPAERTWAVGVDASLSVAPKGPPIKVWRLE